MDARHPQIGKLLRTTFAGAQHRLERRRADRANALQLNRRACTVHNKCSAEGCAALYRKVDWVRSDGLRANRAPEPMNCWSRLSRSGARHENDNAYKIKLDKRCDPLRAIYRLRAILSRLEV
jgi:hypothetical protein